MTQDALDQGKILAGQIVSLTAQKADMLSAVSGLFNFLSTEDKATINTAISTAYDSAISAKQTAFDNLLGTFTR